MALSDINFIFQWWFVLFLVGVVFLPLTATIFSSFFDKGYVFAKVLGTIIIAYIIFVLGTLHLAPFTQSTIFGVAGLLLGINILILKKHYRLTIKQLSSGTIKIVAFEELLFFAALFFWSYIRSFQPDIHGLEKYMDFGFVNSILRSEYFPPKDMWFTPFSINYYYFGHLYTAVLTKLSGIPSSITYNLMLATLFALTFTAAFSIGMNLLLQINNKLNAKRYTLYAIIGGFFTALLVSLAGNLHAVYSFFKPYLNENPLPFWQLAFSPETFPNSYWYPNATRFIYNTIHEFPIYSFVVSDLHGHVLGIPIVLTTIAVLFLLISKSQTLNPRQITNSNSRKPKHFEIFNFGHWNLFRNWKLEIRNLLLISFLLAVMYMTNAWDGIIYFLLAVVVLTILNFKSKFTIYNLLFTIGVVGIGFVLFSLPFNLFFKPFVSGIGVLCAPEFLTKIGSFGPFLFEPDHCQHSPFWQLLILYGFFYFWIVMFLLRTVILKAKPEGSKILRFAQNDIFIIVLITISTLLILMPELIYVKDIYPAHYRANTMFKLDYQAFIMLSLSSGYIIIRLISYWKLVVFGIGSIGLFLVMVYPYFAINSYYGSLQIYYGLDGTKYLKRLYPTDYEAVLWLNQNIKGQPVVLEAQGDSYTDFARVSTNTGLPTVLGWTVHEWLWRGTYAVPAPRIEEVKTLYETKEVNVVEQLIKKYNIELVFIGDLERQKYQNLDEEKFKNLGKLIYQNSQTKIYRIIE